MRRARPINADVPVAETPLEATAAPPPVRGAAPNVAQRQAKGEPAKPPAASKPLAGPARPKAKEALPKQEPRPEVGGKDAIPPAEHAAPAPSRRPRPSRRRRKPVPGALKAIAALVAIAILFIVVAVLGGTSGENAEEAVAPAPVVVSPPAPAEAPPAEGPAELGYPVLATSNTTRVGGADAAANAAGVALATYPSTTPRQRPIAVALVDPDNWQDAIAAAVLMAAPIGAPLLVSDSAELPEETAAALAALNPRGGRVTAGAQVFALGDIAVPAGVRATRVRTEGPAGAGAAAIARLRDRLHGGAPEHIVIAPAGRSGFAAPAAAWAARSGDPVLFSGRDRLPRATVAALKRHPEVPVFVLGPSAAISSDVVRQVGEVSERVRRVSGETPVENAIALARYDDGGFGWNVNDPGHGFVVARAGSPLNAAVAAPLSASGTWGPLLLTAGAGTLPSALRGYLLDVKPGYTTDPTRAFYNHVWVIGNPEEIDVRQQAEIDELAELARIGGKP